MKKRAKKFLKLPEFPGGKEAFKKYIKENLIYPKEAVEKQIQGIVHLIAEIDDNGDVHEVIIENGVGGGCNEEAVRLIKNIQFGGVKNKGIRLKTNRKFKIEFKLPSQTKINYQVTFKSKDNISVSGKKYSYTIPLNKNKN